MSIGNLFSDGNERQAANVEKGGYKRGFKFARQQYKRGFKGLANDYADAKGEFGTYADALGLNGDEGNTRAVDTFHTSPGYDFRLDEGLKAIDRTAASRGMLGSGNTAIDTLKYAGDLADNEYGGWMDRLEGLGTKQAAIDTGLGDARYGYKSHIGDLGYATKLGMAGVKANYLRGKDQSGANAVGAITGVASLGSKLLGL